MIWCSKKPKIAQDSSDLTNEQIERNLEPWKENPALRRYEVVDTTTQEIVAFAQYKIYHEDTIKLISYLTVEDMPRLLG